MSHFAVGMTEFAGDETTTGYENTIRCRSMQHGIELPVVAHGANRTDGASIHGCIVLGHDIDAATPRLRLACVQGTNIPEATITRLAQVDGATNPTDIVKVGTVHVVAVYLDTPRDMATDGPADEPVEYLVLDYQEIKWEHRIYENGVDRGSVIGSYDVTTMSTVVSIS